MSFLDQLSAKMNQGFNQVASQTKDFTEQVKIENEIKNLEKAVNACYEKLGRTMYHASRFPSDTPVEYEEMMRQVDGLLQQIQEKKESKQKIASKVTCPSGGKSVPAGTKFCSFCGAPMEQTPVAAAVPTEPPVCDGGLMRGDEQQMGDEQMHVAERDMSGERHCPNCGEVVEPGAKFCVKCGTRIDVEEQKHVGEQKPAEAGGLNASEDGTSCSVKAENSAETEKGSAGNGDFAGTEAEGKILN